MSDKLNICKSKGMNEYTSNGWTKNPPTKNVFLEFRIDLFRSITVNYIGQTMTNNITSIQTEFENTQTVVCQAA